MAFASIFDICSGVPELFFFAFFEVYTKFSESFAFCSNSFWALSKDNFKFLYILRVLLYVSYASFSFWKCSDNPLFNGSITVVLILSLNCLNVCENVLKHFVIPFIDVSHDSASSSDNL